MSRDDSESSPRRHRRSLRHGDPSPFAKERDVAPSNGPADFTPRAPDSPPASSSASRHSPSLDSFRGPAKRLAIHPLETALLWVIAAHLVFLPWALGAVRLWAQVISLLFSLASFLLALWPRRYTPDQTGTTNFRALPLPKLLKFPIFWIGLALLALITIQGLNPAWEYQTNGKVWWMRAIPHVTWLPHGVRVPFNPPSGLAQGGEWRMLIVYASAFLTVCAAWIGFTRRRTLQRLFVVLAVNGAALSIFGLAQRILGATKIFGFVDSPNPSFFSSFIYKNHAGAYLDIGVAIAVGLGAWYYVRGVRRLEKSSPAGVFAFLMTCIAVSVLVSYARGATLTMLAYLCLVVAAFVWYQWRLPASARRPIITIAMLVVFGFFLKTGLDALNSELAWDRLRQAISGSDVSVEARLIADHASFDMLGEHWGLGTGSGGFPFLFPVYQQHYPEIAHRQFWPHAHNDVLEIPIELGLPGMLLILASFAYWAVVLVRTYVWDNPLSASILAGCLALIGMAYGDFIFYCPAVLITWCALWPVCTRWTQLEEQRARA